MSSGWPVIGSVREYQNPYFGVDRLSIKQPSGERGEYYRVRTDGEGVLAVAVEDHQLFLIKLYRPRLEERLLEVPGGGIEPNESAKEAAHREFTEETRYTANSSEYIGSFYSSAWVKEKQHVVFLTNIEPVNKDQDGREEEIEDVLKVPVGQAFDKVISQTTAGSTVAALQLAKQKDLIPTNI